MEASGETISYMKKNISPVCQTLQGDCYLQAVRSLTLQFQIKILAVEEEVEQKALLLPLSTQKDLPSSRTWLGER